MAPLVGTTGTGVSASGRGARNDGPSGASTGLVAAACSSKAKKHSMHWEDSKGHIVS